MTALLLDTRVLLWWLSGDERLPGRMRVAVADGENEVFVSAASAWEMSIEAALGELTVPDGLREELQQRGSASCRSPWTTAWPPVPYPATTTIPSTGCSSRRPPGAGCDCSPSIDASGTTTFDSCDPASIRASIMAG